MRFKSWLEDTEGIITAQNPDGRKASPEANTAANRRLRKDLQHLDPQSVKGSYNGNDEKSFRVPKVGKETLTRLGKKYRQKAVMLGGNEILP